VIVMLQQFTMLVTLTGPIGMAIIGGGYAVFRWSQTGDIWWWIVPVGTLAFGLWWHRRWRRRFAARVLQRIARGSGKDAQ
jgi:hypothetical protein